MLYHSQSPLARSDAPEGAKKIRCRQIEPDDLGAVGDLLAVGFPLRRRSYWTRALDRLSHRPPIAGYPRYGYMLECDGAAIGVMLLLFSKAPGSGEIRCNGSSWYVAPEFRSLGAVLVTRSLKHRATHTNISPVPNVKPIFEALGYEKFCNGLFLVAPSLAALDGKTKIVRVSDSRNSDVGAGTEVTRILMDHARFGCFSLWCETQGEGSPFIFARRFVKKFVPAAQLIYCESIEQFARRAGPLGRYLASRGMPFMIAQANAPIPGLVGKFFGDRPMYYRGPHPPRLGDLSYTEQAIFGP